MKRIVLLLACSTTMLQATIISEFMGSAFFPTSRTLRKIYGVAWQNYGLNVGHVPELNANGVRNLSIFGMVNYIFAHGASINGGQRTDIKLVPLAIGLKWVQPIYDNVQVYIAGAPRFCYMKIDNSSAYVPAQQNSRTIGGYVGVGSFLTLPCGMIIDFALDYTYAKFGAPASTDTYIGFPTNASGFSLGLGLGWEF